MEEKVFKGKVYFYSASTNSEIPKSDRSVKPLWLDIAICH